MQTKFLKSSEYLLCLSPKEGVPATCYAHESTQEMNKMLNQV